jgi:hypothetical protein
MEMQDGGSETKGRKEGRDKEREKSEAGRRGGKKVVGGLS